LGFASRILRFDVEEGFANDDRQKQKQDQKCISREWLLGKWFSVFSFQPPIKAIQLKTEN
jgi:hypothetical protein